MLSKIDSCLSKRVSVLRYLNKVEVKVIFGTGVEY